MVETHNEEAKEIIGNISSQKQVTYFSTIPYESYTRNILRHTETIQTQPPYIHQIKQTHDRRQPNQHHTTDRQS